MAPTLVTLAALLLSSADGGTPAADGGASAADAGTPDAGVNLPLSPEDTRHALYTLGYSLGGGVAGFELTPAELDVVIDGLSDNVKGRPPQVPPQQYVPHLRALHQQRLQAQVQRERQRAKAFLAKAAADRRAVKLQSGLIYKDVKRGDGPRPRPTDTVRVHYRGTLVDGTEFDSSHARGEPAEFELDAVIPCWTEALLRMRVGGTARIVCPSELAYGDRGVPPEVPGGAALVFDVELLGVTPRAPADAGTPDAGGP